MYEEAPTVSIVMVAYGGGWAWVPRALDALRRNTAEPYEVLLVDNGGADERSVPDPTNVEVLRNEDNLGFGAASNIGVARARADVVCLLNTDVLVEPGWLEPLLELVRDGGVGAAFPAKLHLDGRLQEAGAFVTREALVYIFGDGDDADAPEYRFRHEVDFGSASAMCIARGRYQSLGGFDPAYGIAYFEDTDLCFRLREQRLRVVYEPRARVRHARGASAPVAAVAEVVAANQRVFFGRWRHALAGRPTFEEVFASAHVQLSARDVHARRRVLLLGDDLATHRLAENLATADPTARVTLLVEDVAPDDKQALLNAGVEVLPTDGRDWLSERAGHYSHVVRPPEATWLRLRNALHETQPQALFVAGGPDVLARLMC